MEEDAIDPDVWKKYGPWALGDQLLGWSDKLLWGSWPDPIDVKKVNRIQLKNYLWKDEPNISTMAILIRKYLDKLCDAYRANTLSKSFVEGTSGGANAKVNFCECKVPCDKVTNMTPHIAIAKALAAIHQNGYQVMTANDFEAQPAATAMSEAMSYVYSALLKTKWASEDI